MLIEAHRYRAISIPEHIMEHVEINAKVSFDAFVAQNFKGSAGECPNSMQWMAAVVPADRGSQNIFVTVFSPYLST